MSDSGSIKVSSASKETTATTGPSPMDFDQYLPWACIQLQLHFDVMVTRIVQNEYVSVASDRSKSRAKPKPKNAHSRTELALTDKEDTSTSAGIQNKTVDDEIVRIYTIYDNFDNLVHLKFDKNKCIPRRVLQVIGLIVKFHVYLISLTINRGLNRYSIHEICKMIPKSRITDLCLDGTFLERSEYYLLLENSCCLKQLSLARCKIDDEALKNIAKNLVYPLPASTTLSILNVSSNKFCDEAVKYLAEALKSNRHLIYLNLADNMITDEGVSILLDTLIEFPLSVEESIQAKTRKLMYLNEKKKLIDKLVLDLKYSDEKKSSKKKPNSAPEKKAAKGLEKEINMKNMLDVNKSLANGDMTIYEKAESIATNTLGTFIDPFSPMNIRSKEGVMNCFGNNTIAYLNLSYTNITYFSLKKLLNVLLYQKRLYRTPKGLINLCIEGNAFPTSCIELAQIDDILEDGLISHYRKHSVIKKKPVVRGK